MVTGLPVLVTSRVDRFKETRKVAGARPSSRVASRAASLCCHLASRKALAIFYLRRRRDFLGTFVKSKPIIMTNV
jgi:hypothetical protein